MEHFGADIGNTFYAAYGMDYVKDNGESGSR